MVFVANRPLNFKAWEDFPGLEKLPAGTVVSRGKFLGRDLVYFSNANDGSGFSMTQDAAADIENVLKHLADLSEL